jgi:OmpA-OmpF porin, OOP family
VHFESKQRDLSPFGKRILDKAAATLRDNLTVQVKIIGHTSEEEFPDENNRKLSKQRAESIQEYLIAQQVDPSRLSIDWKGGQEPIADNKTAEGRALNRRVEMEAFSPPSSPRPPSRAPTQPR